MDTAVFEIVDESAVPAQSERYQPKGIGRIGAIWAALLSLPAGRWVKVSNRDRDHMGSTNRHLTEKAKKLGRTYTARTSGTTLYCKLESR